MQGKDDGGTGVENRLARRRSRTFAALSLGYSLFDRALAFIFTYDERPPTQMQRGTTFRFATYNLSRPPQQVHAAASAEEIKTGGGVK